MLTDTSCIINFVSLFYSGIQVQRAEIPLRSLQRPAGVFTQPSYKTPVITFTTSPTSSLRTRATRTSPSCSTRTPLSPILRFSPSKKPQPAKTHGAWSHSSFEASCAALLSQAPLRSRSALCTSTMSWPRNVTLPLNNFDACMGTCTQHNVDFIGGDFNMSAFSTVGDVFGDTEFSAPGKSFPWGLGALESHARTFCTSTTRALCHVEVRFAWIRVLVFSKQRWTCRQLTCEQRSRPAASVGWLAATMRHRV